MGGEVGKPAMSPGGTRVAYAAAGGRLSSMEIYVINIRTRKVTQITNNGVFVCENRIMHPTP